MVIIMHSPVPATINPVTENYGPFLVLASYFTSPCVPLFFMISGALLLPCKTGVNAFDFIKKRLMKVVGPTFCFSILYVLWNKFPTGVGDAICKLLSFPLAAQGHGVMWFMYTLIGLYLLIPIISHWIRSASKSELEFYLCLWGVTLMYPYIDVFLEIDTRIEGILYYFVGYGGYLLLGYYLSKYEVSLKVLLPLAILMLPMPLFNKIFNWNLDFVTAFWYLSMSVAIMTAAWFVIIKRLYSGKKISGIWGKFIESTSNFGFGIYLVHIFLMRAFIWYLPFIECISNYYLQTFVVAILTFVGSWLFSWVISKLPYSQYVIGYTSKNINR